MELVNKVVKDNTISNKVINFPIDNIDTSWMTNAQNKIFDIVKNENNRDKKPIEICKLAGYKTNGPWYKAIKDERFANLLESIGVNVNLYNKHYPSHNEVEYIKNPKEREEYLKSDIWDMRRLFEEYPRHYAPFSFIIEFTKISNVYIRYEIKRYFINMLSNWKPATFKRVIKELYVFFDSMYKLFPNLNSLNELQREAHIESILTNMNCSKKYKRLSVTTTKTMFEYMYYNKWDNAPSIGLLNKYDNPKVEKTLPRPIPPNIKI